MLVNTPKARTKFLANLQKLIRAKGDLLNELRRGEFCFQTLNIGNDYSDFADSKHRRKIESVDDEVIRVSAKMRRDSLWTRVTIPIAEYLDFAEDGKLWAYNTKIFFLGQVKWLRDQAAKELKGWNAAVKKYEKLIS